MSIKVNAVIMAAGLSKRMNQNKLLMKIDNKCIYEFILETIKNCKECFNDVIVVAKDEEILRKSLEFGFTITKNETSHLGQSTSLKQGIINSKKSDGYMFFVADQPFIRKETVIALLNIFEKNPKSIIMACYNCKNGNPVIFPESLKGELLKLEGDLGGREVIKENLDKLVKVHIKSENEFMDIDTIEDYKLVKERWLNEGGNSNN